MIKLYTLKDALPFFAEGKALEDNDGDLWRVRDTFELLLLSKGETAWYSKVNPRSIKFPLTPKEEPDYLYEVEWYIEESEGIFTKVKKIMVEGCIVKYNMKRTGRKYQLIEGVPVEVK